MTPGAVSEVIRSLPAEVRIREVGPRDGLQAEQPIDVDQRVQLIDALSETGLPEIEAVSFVSPTAVPAMARADEVMRRIRRRDDVSYVALVPNVRGAELALDAGVDGLNVTISASPAYNEKNVRRTIAESLASIGEIVARAAGLWVDVTISCAFGSPYEGDIPPLDVASLARQVTEQGATSLTFADTTGMATPRRVADLVAVVGTDVRFHFHETRGTGLVNAFCALQLGVSAFDTSVGGLGGSPFAHGAGGNLATEGLVAMLDDLGVSSGVSIDRVVDAAQLVGRLVGRPVPSPVAHAGPRSRLASAEA
ncbi:MAG TPA: hydroxymethylglutaryl-CoA lyase [Acidimicrobiales bacterium]|jgi:hydroxymethylglutaryl-CoA lyase|nr:hydroxymethylglutaryl-CoA lyase [Acidimicrobiales bacterium]